MVSNSRRLAQIEAKMASPKKSQRQLGRATEQIARTLYLMLRDAEREGHSRKSLVARALRIDDEGHAQKQLDELTIPSDIRPEKLTNRLSRLQKKPNHYVAVAREWANRLGRDGDDAVLRLFDGTDYGADSETEDSRYETADLVAAALGKIARKTSDGLHLKKFWEELLETSGRYDPRIERILPASQGIYIEAGGLKGNAICVDEMSPIASVSLLRRLQQDPVKGASGSLRIPSRRASIPHLRPCPTPHPSGA